MPTVIGRSQTQVGATFGRSHFKRLGGPNTRPKGGRNPSGIGRGRRRHGAGGKVDFWSLENGFVLACLPGAELGKRPVFKGFSQWENGFVLSKRKI
jgi:hypothetical protein